MDRTRLERLVRAWRWQTAVRGLLFALAVGNGMLVLTGWRPALGAWQVPLLSLVGTFLVLLAVSRPWRLDVGRLGHHLDRTYPTLEESTGLCLRDAASLSLLERLQRQRAERAFADLRKDRASGDDPGAPPRDFLRASSLCLAVAAFAAGVSGLWQQIHLEKPRFVHAETVPASGPPTTPGLSRPGLPKIVGSFFSIVPPAYTGHPLRQANGFALEAEEGSQTDWDITVNQPLRTAHLAAGSLILPLAITPDGHLHGSATLTQTSLFSLVATLPDGTVWNPPELFSVKVIKDQPPAVRLLQPGEARTEVAPPAAQPVAVEAEVLDDYGVAEAHLVATVAKGSGEAVKFREQSIAFEPAPSGGDSRSRHFSKALDLAALGLEPGDELYFFVEATDNRQPAANHTRSETRFIVLRGPETKPMTTGRGVAGVNLVPQYFRSERQIILDTEKLLADHPTLSEVNFRARANDLGQDQAFLRLRYGRFLGEDQEDSPLTDHLETTNQDPLQAKTPEPPAGSHAAASLAARFAQEHVEQDREGVNEDAPPPAPANGLPLTAAQIRQPFVDSHDQHDKNTFFDQGTQGTMHDVLNAMWEAEKLLRIARPQEALAPEHRALEILKNLQQSDRAYVQHVGFDAPPLKVAERRLKGEVADVPTRSVEAPPQFFPDADAVAARAALAEIAQWNALSAQTLARLEPALTAAATRQPDAFLSGLAALRLLRNDAREQTASLPVLEGALLRLLPPVHALPVCTEQDAPETAAIYYHTLEAGHPQP